MMISGNPLNFALLLSVLFIFEGCVLFRWMQSTRMSSPLEILPKLCFGRPRNPRINWTGKCWCRAAFRQACSCFFPCFRLYCVWKPCRPLLNWDSDSWDSCVSWIPDGNEKYTLGNLLSLGRALHSLLRMISCVMPFTQCPQCDGKQHRRCIGWTRRTTLPIVL